MSTPGTRDGTPSPRGQANEPGCSYRGQPPVSPDWEDATVAQLIEHVMVGTASVTGQAFFPVMVEHLASTLRVPYAAVTERRTPDSLRLTTLAVWRDHSLAENFEYEATGTPCEVVLTQGSAHYASNVQALFPHDRDLSILRAQCYLGRALKDSHGHVIGHICIVSNKPLTLDERLAHALVTIFAARATAELERLRVERDRARLANDLKSLLESTGEGIWGFDLDGRCTFLNRAASRLLGVSPEEALGTPLHELVHRSRPDGSPCPVAECPIWRSIRSGQGCRVEDDTFWKRDGTTFSVSYSSFPIIEAGVIKGGVVAFGDITDRKRAEERLRQSEARLKEVQQVAHIGSWELDLTRNILTWSDEIYRIFEIDPSRFGATYEAFLNTVHPDDRALVDTVYTESVRDRKPYELVHRLLMSDGRVKYVYERCQTFYGDDGRPVRSVGTVQDITERVKLEEQLRQAQKMDAVGRLAGGIAHDFNNLLTVITGYSELVLQRLRPDDPLFQPLSQIKKAGDRGTALVGQLLAFSRRQVIEPKPLNLNTVVRDMAGMLERLIGEHIRLVTQLDPDIELIQADPGQIEQVIMNLAVNARDAMPKGGTLTIETATADLDATALQANPALRPGPYVSLTVRDTGSGMDEDTRAHIFEPFFTTKEQGKGTGLGLAVVYGVVTQNGGMITVDSAPGRGTAVTIYLPRYEGGAILDRQPSSSARSVHGRETILLVEDEEGVRTLAKAVLEHSGYTVLAAGSSAEAIRISGSWEGPIHLLLTDVVMPGMSGRELADCLAAARPDIRVLYMSGHTDDALVHHGVQEARVRFLRKPFTLATLTNVVRKVLDAP